MIFLDHSSRKFSSKKIALTTAALCAAMTVIASAAEITVPNGDFSNPGNNGTVGGAPPNSGSEPVPIGGGPWQGYYDGGGSGSVPSVSIENGQASISGITSVPDAQGDALTNTAYLAQTIPGITLQSNTNYTLSADINVGRPITRDELAAADVGIGFGSAFGVFTSDIYRGYSTLDSLGGNTYRLAITYLASGGENLRIVLLNRPYDGQSLSQVVPEVTFDNLRLESSPYTSIAAAPLAAAPEPGAFVLAGLGMAAVWAGRMRTARGRFGRNSS